MDLDQVAGNRSPRPVELGGAVGGLPKEDDAAVGETVEQGAEGWIVESRHRLGDPRDQTGQFRVRPILEFCFVLVRLPAMLADEGYEADLLEFLGDEVGLASSSELQQGLLALARTDRDDEATANRQLLLQRLGNLGPPGRNDDGVERGEFDPSPGAIARAHEDILVAEAIETIACRRCERGMTLDDMDPRCDPAEDRRRIAGTAADFEHPIAGPHIGRFEHQGDDIGLGDGLLLAYGQRTVLIGEFLQALIHEDFARHLPHGFQYVLVADATPGDLRLDHMPARAPEVRYIQHARLSDRPLASKNTLLLQRVPRLSVPRWRMAIDSNALAQQMAEFASCGRTS
jgi:hypothetical protein